MTSLLEIIKPKRHQNYPNPKCLYCGCVRSFSSGSLCSFCWYTQAVLKRTGVTVPTLANANFDFDKATFARLCRLMNKKRALDELIQHVATSLAVRKFRNQQKQKMPCPIESDLGEYNEAGYRESIAVTTRTPLDDLLEKEEIEGQRDAILRTRMRQKNRNHSEDKMIDEVYEKENPRFRNPLGPAYFKTHKGDTRDIVCAVNFEAQP